MQRRASSKGFVATLALLTLLASLLVTLTQRPAHATTREARVTWSVLASSPAVLLTAPSAVDDDVVVSSRAALLHAFGGGAVLRVAAELAASGASIRGSQRVVAVVGTRVRAHLRHCVLRN